MLLVGTEQVRTEVVPNLSSQGEDIRLLSYPENALLGSIANAASNKQAANEYNFRPVFESSFAGSLKAMALNGHGVAWLPQLLIQKELASGQLAQIGGDDLQFDMQIMLYRKSDRLSVDSERLWSFITAEK